MKLRPGHGRWAVVVVLAAGMLAAGVIAAMLAAASGQPAVTARDLRIPVADGPGGGQHVVLDATFFTPAGTGRVPAILLAHGFGETKDATRPEAETLAGAGFAVLTWTARGFGDSTGQIALDSPDYEVKDVQQLVSWLARQPRVLLDHPGDPRVGIAGASYGGGIALLAAAYDHRIDAVVPLITWNSLATALFPDAAGGSPLGGVFKRQWAGLLFTRGSAGSGSLPGSAATGPGLASTAQCGRFLPQICAIYQQAATLGRATPQAVSLLWQSSPASVASRIDVPALLIQGEEDSLFGLDQADANYQAIRRNGAPVDMVWFAGGHDGGDQESARVSQLTLDWFDHWLKPRHLLYRPGTRWRGPTGQPAFAVTQDLGFDSSSGKELLGVATAPSYPGLNGTRRTLVRLTGAPRVIDRPPGGAPPSVSILPGVGSAAGSLPGGLAFDMPGQSAVFTSAPLRAPVTVTGAPTVTVTVTGTGPVTLFAGLYDVDQAGNAVLPEQLAAPLSVAGATGGAARTVTVRLAAIEYQFAAGHRLRLVLTTTDFAYATPAAPAAYRVALAGAGVKLPWYPALVIHGTGVPWWTWAAPPAALAAAALILAGRRRPRAATAPDAARAETPLEITGLTKRFRHGQLAVDNLSLRVERRQIFGLLGPNGAGKTTTLRLLMGLLHPDAGTITIFGQRVHPGSPALSRLGAFVEGAGFPPHLSGRANLEMYWQATGRARDGAGMERVLEIAGLGAAVDRPVRGYSRGMRQRLAIAQAMLGMPDLLVLDEPMNGLDPPQIRQMREVLLRYAADGRSVILSSHLLTEVELTCTHVLVMRDGRRLAAGSVRDIAGKGAELVVETPEPARAAAALAELAGIARIGQFPGGVLVQPDGAGVPTVIETLIRAGVPVERVDRNRRLEDAFLTLIGEQRP
jgi:ABC-2 type transport system ATP-binding protein